MNKNKNISIWRGDTPPPSKFHLWQKNNKLYHNDGIDWIENEIDNASNENSGLMSKEDKERLDNLVYDGLDSNDQNRALSANQGNVLLGKIETIKLSAYKVKGSVENISDIPLVDIQQGDVYNILNSFYINNKKYPEGTNVVWTGTQFDPLGGTVDFKDYSTTEQINEIVTTLENNVNNSLDNLNSIKSDKTYVNEQLATKADITYVDNKVSPKADKTYVDTQLATKANTGYVNAQVEILTTALETKVDKVSGKGLSTNDYTTEEKNLVATINNKSDKGLLCIGQVDNQDNFLSRIENHSIVTNPSIQIITATYKVGNGTGTFIALQQVRTNNSGDGGGTTMQYIYADKARLTRYIDFTSTRIIQIQQTQIDNARNLQYQNSTISLTDMWGQVIGSTIDLSWGDRTAIREGTSTTSQVQLTVTKPFGNTTSTYLTPASSAKAGIMTSDMYNKLNRVDDCATTYNIDRQLNIGDYIPYADLYTTTLYGSNAQLKEPLQTYILYEQTRNYTDLWIAYQGEPIYYSSNFNPDSQRWYITKVGNFSDYEKRLFDLGINKALEKAESNITNLQSSVSQLSATKADSEQVNEQIAILSKQRTSFVTPCFSDCDTTHETKCNKITLAGGELGFGFKSIFSVTIKIAENLSLLNQTPTYLHINDLFGNSIGVSMNGVKQMLNLGKYATWYFDSAINISGAPIILSLHTTNVASSASDSNLVKIIAHVNQREGMIGCGVTDENGTHHTDWTPALGINIVDLSAVYPQIKELQKYRMAYATSELPDISTTGHKANVKEIRINQNVMGISLVNSVSIMVASDNAYSGALELRVYDINSNLIATSNNTVNLSQNLGKYVTWYFTPFQLNADAIYKFSVWNSGTSQVMRIHVASGKSEGVTCFDQNNSPHTDYCPAFGINISAIFADDLNVKIKNLETNLNQRVHRDDVDTIISEYIESNPINTDKVYWEGGNETQTEFNRDLLSKYYALDSNLQESVNMLNAKIDGGTFSKDYEATLKYKIGKFDEWYAGGGHSFYADANQSYNTIRIELTKGQSIIIQPAFSCILVSVNDNWGTCLATFSKHNTTPYNISTTGTYYISLFDSNGYPVSGRYYVARVITSYSSITTQLENKIYLLEERIAALENK